MITRKQVKFIKSLKIKKFRSQERSFLVEGTKNVLELIDSDFAIRMILVTKQFMNENGSKLASLAAEIITVKSQELQSLGTFKTNEDCLAVAELKDWGIETLDWTDHLFLFDGIADPGNMGTIIRTLDWFGYYQLICSDQSTDFYNPKVIHASMGSFTRARVYYQDLHTLLKSTDRPVFGADLNGTPLHSLSIDRPSIFILGSESHGISAPLREMLTDHLTIPRVGQAESLNVAMATGILCYHLRNR